MQKPTLPEETRGTLDGAPPRSGAGPVWVVGACPGEPDRLGEVLRFPPGAAGPGPFRIFGRGGFQPDDPHPRLSLVRDRPGGTKATPDLGIERISRTQLVVRARDEGSVEVRNVGRVALLVNGEPVTEAVVHPGDVVELGRQLLFVCAERAPFPEVAEDVVQRAPFGGADASGIVGESGAAWQLRQQVAFLAAQAGHVLVTGESGTGKELVARALHALSPRRTRAFVARSAATLPEGLIDAELFGNVRNYPHAGLPERPGLVGRADGGTLFLDEIGELSPELQGHLLRLLDGGEYHPLGEARTRVANVRLVAATNRDAESLKHDLLARLPLRVTVPPLGERREDVPLLARHVLRVLAASDPSGAGRFLAPSPGGGEPRWALGLVRALVRHEYTTHVRELERLVLGAIERSAGDTLLGESPGPASSSSAVTPPARGSKGGDPDPEGSPATLSPAQIQACLDANNGALDPTAKALGLKNRHVLSRLIARHGLEVRRRPKGRGS